MGTGWRTVKQRRGRIRPELVSNDVILGFLRNGAEVWIACQVWRSLVMEV